jgi:colanic acid/amylovoran biosynthesis glycosyltransferase
MAGNGVLYTSVKNLIGYYKLQDNVKLLGVISQTEFISYLKDSRAFVQHSITPDNGDMEGTPLSVLEACAAGVPVISTFHAGIPDVITHGVNGLLCEEHDVATMIENMKLVLKDKNKALEIGKAAKENIKNNFRLDSHLGVISNAILAHI